MEGYMYSPNVAIVELQDSDNVTTGYVICSVPGGRPMFSFDNPTNAGVKSFAVVDAPKCDSLTDLINFVNTRWGN